MKPMSAFRKSLMSAAAFAVLSVLPALSQAAGPAADPHHPEGTAPPAAAAEAQKGSKMMMKGGDMMMDKSKMSSGEKMMMDGQMVMEKCGMKGDGQQKMMDGQKKMMEGKKMMMEGHMMMKEGKKQMDMDMRKDGKHSPDMKKDKK